MNFWINFRKQGGGRYGLYMAWNETVMLHKTTGLEGYYMLLSDTNFEKKISSNYEWKFKGIMKMEAE